jgi:hypothetical protein
MAAAVTKPQAVSFALRPAGRSMRRRHDTHSIINGFLVQEFHRACGMRLADHPMKTVRACTRKEDTLPTTLLQSFAVAVLVLLLSPEANALMISIDPARTYLFTNDDPWWGGGSPAGATPIVLNELGISGGDVIQLERLGDFYNGYAGYEGDVSSLDLFDAMIGVFSNSETLLASNILDRVPGALDAGAGLMTGSTLFGDMTTDIAQDFGIGNIFLQVPVGATHLFVAAHDIYYSDNSDPDGDFAVRITQVASVPEPSTVSLLALGLGSLVLLRRRFQSTHG